MSTLIQATEIRICDDDYNELAVLDTYETLTYTERFSGRDSWDLTIKRGAKNTEYLTKGRILHMLENTPQKKTRCLIVKQINVDGDPKNKSESDMITISGNDYASVLLEGRRILDGTDTSTGYDVQTGDAESVMRHYISANLTAATVEARGDPVFRLEAVNQNRGSSVTFNGRFQSLLEMLESCCSSGGDLGWEAVVVEDDVVDWGWMLEWRLREGLDRSETQDVNSPIILSEEHGTAKITEYSDTLPETNLVIVGGQGEAAARTQLIVGDDALTGIWRRESFIDGRDSDDTEALTERGQEVIDNAISTSFMMTFLESASCIYGEQFQIGDIVSVDAGVYGAYDLQVVTVETVYTVAKKSIGLTLGSEIKDVYRIVRDISRGIPDIRK